MASDLRNLTVRLSLDRLNFDQGLSSVNRALNTLRGELTSTQSGMGGFENETERVRARMDVLARTVQAQEEKVRQLRQSYDQAAQATGEDSRATQIYAAQVNRAVTELARLQGELSQTTEQLHRMESSTSSASERMATMGNKLQNAGLQIGAVFGSIALVVGGALKDAISKGADFEAEIAKVGSKADASSSDLKKLSEAAIKLAPLAGGAKNAASAMDDLAAKGYSVNQILEAMPGIISAANASGEDLALTSDTITSALETFKLKVTDTNHVADVLAKTANLTAAGMTDLQYTFKYAAAPAAALGISMEQLAAMTGIMANQGIKGEQAGTSLREAMLRLVKPPKEAANELHNLGVKVTDNKGNFKNFSDIIGDLNNSTSKMTNAQKTAALAHIFGTNAVSGMLAVISGGKPKIDQFTESLVHSDGASAKAAKSMQDNFAGSLKKLNGAMDAAKIGIEQALAPALKKIADVVQSVVEKFNNLSPGMKKFIAIGLAVTAVVAGIAAIIGAVLAAVGGFMIAIGELGLTIAGIASTAGIVLAVVAGIAALGVGFYELYKHCKPVRDAIKDIGETFKGLFLIVTGQGGKGASILEKLGFSPTLVSKIVAITEQIRSAFEKGLKAVSKLVDSIGKEISDFWKSHGEVIMKDAKVIWKNVSDVIQKLLSVLIDYFRTYLAVFIEEVKLAWIIISDNIKTYVQMILDVVRIFADLFSGNWKDLWAGIKQLTSDFINGIRRVITDLFNAIKTDIVPLLAKWWNAFSKWFDEKKKEWKVKLDEWWIAIGEWFDQKNSDIRNKLEEWWNSIGEWFHSIPGRIKAALIEWGNEIVKWTKEQNEENKRQFSQWGKDIETWFKSIPEKLKKSLESWWKSIGDWFQSKKQEWTTNLDNWWKTISDWFTQKPKEWEKGLEKWWKSIQKWFSDVPAKLKKELDNWWETMKSWFNQLPEKKEVKDSGSKIVDKVKEGVDKKKKDFMDHLGQYIVDGLQYALEIAGVVAVSVARELIKRMLDSFEKEKTKVETKMNEIGNKITDTISKVNLFDIGSNIVQGLIKGMDSFLGDVQKKAQDIGNTIANATKNVLGIHSPSRVMMELGGYVSEGMAIGMDNNAHKVIAASNNLAKSAVPNVGQFGSLAANGSGAGRSGINVTVNTQSVDMDEYQLVRTLQRMEALYG